MKRLASVFISFAFLLLASAVFAAGKAPAKPAAPPPDSLALLEKAVAKDSTKFDNLYKLGVMYLEREKMPEAARVFAKANKLKPRQVKVLVNLGVALDAVGRADEAQAFYKDALVATPDDSVAMCRLASSLYAQGKYDEAMGDLRTLIQKKPRSHCAYFTMGVAFADAGIYRDAIRMWRKVVELAPESPEALSAKESIEVLERFLAGK
ncbi:MAG: tetratricopeptide repeat protein [Candidatus Eisenbacteria bacterium]